MQRRLDAFAFIACAILGWGCAPTDGGDDGSGGGTTDAGGQSDAGRDDRVDAAPYPDAPACAATSQNAEEIPAPVDIIWVVDSSGSMDDEAEAVQNALNSFSAFIAASGIDYRVILLGDQASMSVPPPLGGSGEFLHVNVTVNSTDALQKVVSSYASYQPFLRENGVVHFVIVTDDESNWSRSEFDSGLAGLTTPGFPNGYTMHSICSDEHVILTLPPPLPPITGPCSGGLGAGGAADVGDTYIEITADTGGVWRSICESDWAPIFTAVAEAVSVPVPLPCRFGIPEPPEGETLDPDRVNFVYTPSGGSPAPVPRVDSEADCAGGDGWYYDDPAAPTEIVLCPATCDAIGADTTGQVDVQFGCSTIVD